MGIHEAFPRWNDYYDARYSTVGPRLLALSYSKDFFVRCAVAARKELDNARRIELVFEDTRTPKQKEDGDYSLKDDAVRASAIASGQLDEATIAEIWKQYPFGSVLAVAACATTPAGILFEIGGRESWICRIWLCLNPAIPTKLLAQLAEDPPVPRVWIEEESRFSDHRDLRADDPRRIADALLCQRL